MIHSLNENKRWDLLPETEKYNQHYDIDPIFFIRCQSNGNFERYQSYGNYSYCIDEITGQVQDRPVLMEHASELPCCKYLFFLLLYCIGGSFFSCVFCFFPLLLQYHHYYIDI